MGTWGTALFSNDDACDVKDCYMSLLEIQCTAEEAERRTIEECYYNETPEEKAIFWMALASIEWDKGRLSDMVKEKALSFLEMGGDLALWEDDPKSYKKRKEVLEKLKNKLLSPMPPAKKIREPRQWHSPWKLGDLLAYKVIYDKVKYPQMLNQYVLFRVVGIKKTYPSRFSKEYYWDELYLDLYNWHGFTLPSEKEIQKLHLVAKEEFEKEFKNRNKEEDAVAAWIASMFLGDRKKEIIALGNDPTFIETENIYLWGGYSPCKALDIELSVAFYEPTSYRYIET